MKGFPTKYELKLKIAPVLSMDYSSCNIIIYGGKHPYVCM